MVKNKIEQFIKDNSLDFTGTGSSLNGNCVILAGYACYLELDWAELHELLSDDNFSLEAYIELDIVFKHAESNNYGAYWETKEARETYKF